MVRDFNKYKRSYKQPKIYSAKKKNRTGGFEVKKINFRVVSLVSACLLISYFLFFSDYFIINEVIVEGNELVSAEKIQSEVDFQKNILLFDTDYYEELIKNEVPEIKQAVIYKGIPNAVKIVVLEYEKSLVWKSANKYYLVSAGGYAYKDITDIFSEYEYLPLVEDYAAIKVGNNQQVVSSSFIAFINNIDQSISDVANIDPGKFSVTETTVDVFLETNKGYYIKFDSLRSSAKQLDNLKKVLVEKGDEIHDYVDLRIDGWAYYK